MKKIIFKTIFDFSIVFIQFILIHYFVYFCTFILLYYIIIIIIIIKTGL